MAMRTDSAQSTWRRGNASGIEVERWASDNELGYQRIGRRSSIRSFPNSLSLVAIHRVGAWRLFGVETKQPILRQDEGEPVLPCSHLAQLG